FEPFFTTKEQSKGTGLGLSMVHGFAKQSGGHVDIYSEIGYGTAISLYLPDAARRDEVLASDVTPADFGTAATAATVLVVEDDVAVRATTVARVEHLGYHVVEAESGQQALDLLAGANDVDIILTDMVMPGGMTGADLARRVRQLYPGIKIIFSSGYAHDTRLPADGTPWLRKPYTLAQLAETLHHQANS
ncbi:MAG: response regulator, partial [Alphaproteobacteria bacterium]|nr:response regulator [Alphaproteobacteria bacterium]